MSGAVLLAAKVAGLVGTMGKQPTTQCAEQPPTPERLIRDLLSCPRATHANLPLSRLRTEQNRQSAIAFAHTNTQQRTHTSATAAAMIMDAIQEHYTMLRPRSIPSKTTLLKYIFDAVHLHRVYKEQGLMTARMYVMRRVLWFWARANKRVVYCKDTTSSLPMWAGLVFQGDMTTAGAEAVFNAHRASCADAAVAKVSAASLLIGKSYVDTLMCVVAEFHHLRPDIKDPIPGWLGILAQYRTLWPQRGLHTLPFNREDHPNLARVLSALVPGHTIQFVRGNNRMDHRHGSEVVGVALRQVVGDFFYSPYFSPDAIFSEQEHLPAIIALTVSAVPHALSPKTIREHTVRLRVSEKDATRALADALPPFWDIMGWQSCDGTVGRGVTGGSPPSGVRYLSVAAIRAHCWTPMVRVPAGNFSVSNPKPHAELKGLIVTPKTKSAENIWAACHVRFRYGNAQLLGNDFLPDKESSHNNNNKVHVYNNTKARPPTPEERGLIMQWRSIMARYANGQAMSNADLYVTFRACCVMYLPTFTGWWACLLDLKYPRKKKKKRPLQQICHLLRDLRRGETEVLGWGHRVELGAADVIDPSARLFIHMAPTPPPPFVRREELTGLGVIAKVREILIAKTLAKKKRINHNPGRRPSMSSAEWKLAKLCIDNPPTIPIVAGRDRTVQMEKNEARIRREQRDARVVFNGGFVHKHANATTVLMATKSLTAAKELMCATWHSMSRWAVLSDLEHILCWMALVNSGGLLGLVAVILSNQDDPLTSEFRASVAIQDSVRLAQDMQAWEHEKLRISIQRAKETRIATQQKLTGTAPASITLIQLDESPEKKRKGQKRKSTASRLEAEVFAAAAVAAVSSSSSSSSSRPKKQKQTTRMAAAAAAAAAAATVAIAMARTKTVAVRFPPPPR